MSGGGAISRASRASRAWAVGLCLLSCLPPLPAADGDAAIAGTVPAPLGQRLIEWAPDLTRHERRDEDLRYTAFVPPGSVNRGREIAMQGLPGVQACAGCHGQHLRGTGLMPPLAGRSPTYLLRQLVAFQTRDRAGLMAVPMQAVVAKLQLSDLIAVAAYAASESAN